jgi:hypothetical protein
MSFHPCCQFPRNCCQFKFVKVPSLLKFCTLYGLNLFIYWFVDRRSNWQSFVHMEAEWEKKCISFSWRQIDKRFMHAVSKKNALLVYFKLCFIRQSESCMLSWHEVESLSDVSFISESVACFELHLWIYKPSWFFCSVMLFFYNYNYKD